MNRSDEDLKHLMIDIVQHWEGLEVADSTVKVYISQFKQVKGLIYCMRAQERAQWHMLCGLYTIAYYAQEKFEDPRINTWKCCILQQWLEPDYYKHAIKAKVSNSMLLMTPEDFYMNGHNELPEEHILQEMDERKICLMRTNQTVHQWSQGQAVRDQNMRMIKVKLKVQRIAAEKPKGPRLKQSKLKFAKKCLGKHCNSAHQ